MAVDLLWKMEIYCNNYAYYQSKNKSGVFASLVKGLKKVFIIIMTINTIVSAS